MMRIASGMVLSTHVQRALVAEAARAPSVHNVQPARWRFESGAVVLLEDRTRQLAAADPSGHDISVSLGAAFEGMAIALSRLGLALTPPLMNRNGEDTRYRTVAQSEIMPRASGDSLAEWVEQRRAWRGAFAPLDQRQRAALIQLAGRRNDVAIALARESIDETARLNDSCSWEFLRRSEYQAELFEWMRLSPSDFGWHRDGLSADCLAMNAIERTAARVLFRPPIFRLLGRIGIARALVAERAKAQSADAVLAIHQPVDASAFETGRAFYRLWLELTALGIVACPMSSISDSPIGSASIRRSFEIPPARRIVNVLRIGASPATPPRSARLPIDELLLR
jgi:nitroreductase